jgi:hypothetical protein
MNDLDNMAPAIQNEDVLDAMREEMVKYDASVPFPLNGWYDWNSEVARVPLLITGISNRTVPLD